MLVLVRDIRERIVIGHDIWLTILSIKDNQVRLGIEAPREIAIYRDEVYDRLKLQEALQKLLEENAAEMEAI